MSNKHDLQLSLAALVLAWVPALLGLGVVGFAAYRAGFRFGFSPPPPPIVIGSSGWGRDPNPFPASSIAANNLAVHGGGMSPEGQDVIEAQVIYANGSTHSNGANSDAADDALLIRTQVDGSHELKVSHFDGQSFSPATQLRAPDMDPAHPIHFGGLPGRR